MNHNIRTGNRTCFLVTLAAVAVLITACEQPTSSGGSGTSGPDPAQTISDYETDTMDEVYSDEWTSESGDTTLVLKDNTFLLDEGADGLITAGRVARPSADTLQLQTTMIYLEEEDFGDVADSLEFSEIEAYASLLALYGGDFSVPTDSFEYDSWVTEEEFAQQYQATNRAYAEAYFDYIEQLYIDLGFNIRELVPEWDSLIDELLGDTGVDPTTLDGYFEEPEFTYTVQEEPSQNRRVFMGDGIQQDWSFVSDIPTNVTYATP